VVAVAILARSTGALMAPRVARRPSDAIETKAIVHPAADMIPAGKGMTAPHANTVVEVKAA
jgi:hypothetical protein